LVKAKAKGKHINYLQLSTVDRHTELQLLVSTTATG